VSKHLSSNQRRAPLARLCRYYLDCLSHEDLGGVSEPAASTDYVELDVLPIVSIKKQTTIEPEAVRGFLDRVRRDRPQKTVFLGYPTRLRNNRGIVQVEPILLFPCHNNADDRMILEYDLPQINFKALQALSNADRSNLMGEASQIVEELGLNNITDDQPDMNELLVRLCRIRPEWDWRENIDPCVFSEGKPLGSLNQQGIFNRAIFVATGRSSYTRGLESELGRLQAVEESQYHGTALGSWINGQWINRQNTGAPTVDEHQPLLEVWPLNSEQRQAVRQALANPMTVITGPPGTGKSQVVASILVNAAWQSKTVLFSSKNNKAVDVVETRVNSRGPRPILLRLGNTEHLGRIAQHLLNLLAMRPTPSDQYCEEKTAHARRAGEAQSLDSTIENLIDLRNDVDHLEQEVEQLRQDVGEDIFRHGRTVKRQELEQCAQLMQAAIDGANQAEQSFMTRLVWPWLRNRRVNHRARACEDFRELSQQIGLRVPKADTTTDDAWVHYRNQLKERVKQFQTLITYCEKLADLTKSPSLEELSRQRTLLTEKLSENSTRLWEAWLRIQPEERQKQLLCDFVALLNMIVGANEENPPVYQLYRRIASLLRQMAPLLPCWAVTSLSANNRVPFEPAFFDLLIIDESSQCDIASVLPLLYRARRVVIIGDPNQLRHVTTLPGKKDLQLLSKYALARDFLGWAYATNSLFDIAIRLCTSEDIVMLRDHHRSHADIIGFSNEQFYEGRLRVATRYDTLKSPPRDGPAVRWVHISGRTARRDNESASNVKEAHAVVEEIVCLVRQRYCGNLGVVSPFRAQANLIRELVVKKGLAGPLVEGLLSETVHKFQGDERDIIIFSPVVSSNIPDTDGALRFLRTNPDLFNVAITRARAALIVVGDREAARKVDYLSKFATYVERVARHQPTVHQTCPEYGPVYPAVARPDLVSDWESIFYRRLYAAGIRPVPQYQVERYLLDFAVFTDDKRLNIEIDGEMYHRNWDGELCREDQIRNQRLMELGWTVMRFWVYQVRDDLEHCLTRVQQWIDSHNSS